jgi:hypothetical protein
MSFAMARAPQDGAVAHRLRAGRQAGHGLIVGPVESLQKRGEAGSPIGVQRFSEYFLVAARNFFVGNGHETFSVN